MHNQSKFTKRTEFLTSSSELAASYVQPFIVSSVLRRNGSLPLSDVLRDQTLLDPKTCTILISSQREASWSWNFCFYSRLPHKIVHRAVSVVLTSLVLLFSLRQCPTPRGKRGSKHSGKGFICGMSLSPGLGNTLGRWRGKEGATPPLSPHTSWAKGG